MHLLHLFNVMFKLDIYVIYMLEFEVIYERDLMAYFNYKSCIIKYI